MTNDVTRSVEMLKSYKKMSRWYPALEPETGDGTGTDDSHAVSAFGDEDRAAGFPYYIRDEEVEVIPPVDESMFRRSQYTGRWSDWVTDRTPEFTPRERAAELLTFPAESDAGPDSDVGPEPAADSDFDADDDSDVDVEVGATAAPRTSDGDERTVRKEKRSARSTKRPARRGQRTARLESADVTAISDTPRAARTAHKSDAVAASAKFRRRRLIALAVVLVAVLLLALAGGVALFVLHSHGGTAQSVGTMVGSIVVDGRTTTSGIPAG
ncbi:hypothetical protein HLB23_16965 [Nocardia uniformis]|uniref:Uncharacterized protein n=1 Tax=Nocardia uniformis TaxID=53432 RepID=A0A849C203_9NOCA|nr:hypothetical protein [Nocardia uniformis]NNH71536.1 hypothetical protein [Nocardia uniformis]